MHNNPRDGDVERQVETWAASRPGADLSPEVRKKVQDMLAPSLHPVKPLPSQGRLAAAFFFVFAAFALALMGVMLLADMEKTGFHLMTATQMAAMATVLTGGGILFSLTVARRMIPGSRPGPPALLLVALAGGGTLGALALLFPWRTAGVSVSQGWPCASMELMIALPAAVVFYFLARRGALFADSGLGAALSGLAAVLALLVVQFRCMFQQAPHLLIWHGATAAIVIGLGTLFGRCLRDRWV